MQIVYTQAMLKAESLRWKCRAFSFAAIPFVMVIGVHLASRGGAVPIWAVAIAAMAMGAFGALSTRASLDHYDLTGKMVWF